MSATSELSGDRPTGLEVRSPGTGELLATLPVHTEEDVNAAVDRARRAFDAWGGLSHGRRRKHLLDFRRELVRRMDEMIDTIHQENGKPRADAAVEIMLAVSHITHAANRAQTLFRPKTVAPGPMVNMKARIHYEPLGVIGVIGPWNYPLFTPMGSIGYALACGNTAVFKPSELTPLTGKLLAECAQAAIPIPDVLQVVTGFGETGAALARSNVDKVAFTGSARTGRRVMAAAAENLTPVVMELGGNDAMIVMGNADVNKAAKDAVFGGLTNAGQACISVERVFVQDTVYDRFVEAVVREANRVKVGNEGDSQIGAMTMEQIDIVRDHLKDALDKGAKALVGGLDTIKGRFISPTILVDVTPDMKIMKEETFGPVIPISKVQSVDDAVRQANETNYGLGSTVFGGEGAEQIADRLKAGMTAVNSVISFAAVPNIPFGGIGESGFGRIHGDEGMLEFVRTKGTVSERFAIPGAGLGFGDPNQQLDQVKGLIKAMWGGSAIDNATQFISKLRRKKD